MYQELQSHVVAFLEVGNLLNHPPAAAMPNCVPIAFRWPTWDELGSGPGQLALALSVEYVRVPVVGG